MFSCNVVDATVLADVELNVVCSRHNVFNVNDNLLHSLTKTKMLSVQQAKAIMVMRNSEERSLSLVDKLVSNEGFALSRLFFCLSDENMRRSLQWFLLGEAGTTEIEEQVQKDASNPTRSLLYSRHFSDSERAQIADMLILRSRMAHDAAKSHVTQLEQVCRRLKEKRLFLEQRIRQMANSLDVFIRQNAPFSQSAFHKPEARQKVYHRPLVITNGKKLIEDFQKKIEFIINICTQVIQEKEHSWNKLDKMRRRSLRGETKSKSFVNSLTKPEKFSESSKHKSVNFNIFADESESYQRKLTALSEQLTRQENAILRMTVEMSSAVDHYKTGSDGKRMAVFPPVISSK